MPFNVFRDPEIDGIFEANFNECVDIVTHPEKHRRISVATAVTVVRAREPSFQFSDLALCREKEFSLVSERVYRRYKNK